MGSDLGRGRVLGCGDEDVDHLGHPEHRRVQQSGGAPGNPRSGGGGLEVGAGLDQDASNFGVAVPGRGDQRKLRVLGLAIHGRPLGRRVWSICEQGGLQ